LNHPNRFSSCPKARTKDEPGNDRRREDRRSRKQGTGVKVFSLQHAQAAQLKDKVKAVLSEKATIDTDEHANALIITDYNDNVAVAGQLISALDTDKPQDLMVRVISLKNANAQDLAKELEPFYPTKPGGRETRKRWRFPLTSAPIR